MQKVMLISKLGSRRIRLLTEKGKKLAVLQFFAITVAKNMSSIHFDIQHKIQMFWPKILNFWKKIFSQKFM
jgi:hypothetical protein